MSRSCVMPLNVFDPLFLSSRLRGMVERSMVGPFGSEVDEDDLRVVPSLNCSRKRSRSQWESGMRDEVVEPKRAGEWRVQVDVKHFRPDEVEVKTVDGHVLVEGKHEERLEQNCMVSRHFVRKYPLPQGVQEEQVQSILSSQGLLTVSAPKNQDHTKHRLVPITRTGKPHTTPALPPQNDSSPADTAIDQSTRRA